MGFKQDDVRSAMRECNFNKGLGPDGFSGTLLQVDNPRDSFTNNVVEQLTHLLN